jgi:SRSO17 transposase
MTNEQIASLEPALLGLLGRFRPCFKQDRTMGHLQKYLVGLLTDVKRKSIEPIALAAGVPVRTLQQFLAEFPWDHRKARDLLQRLVAEEHEPAEGIGIVDSSGHAKRGDKTPGVQRQWCGESGKIDNCVVGQHLLYTDNRRRNPFSCMLASDLFLPESWSEDRERCREAWIPEDLVHRPKWKIALEQLQQAIGNGIRFAWVTFDEEYGTVPQFWFNLDRLGLRAIGEVQPRFNVWATPPCCRSGRAEHTSKRVDDLVRHSPVFTQQPWRRIKIKIVTRGPVVWKVKAALVQLVGQRYSDHGPSLPTDRRYWLILAHNDKTDETKYLVSNAPAHTSVKKLLEIAFARWHVEKWFERAKQEAGLGAFEVRTYTSLIRHWLICGIAMLFLARQTRRLRGEKSADNVRAGGRGSQRGGLGAVETLAAFPDGTTETVRVLSVA